MTFEDLELIEPIQKALKEEGYKIPTPIQAEAIPIVTKGYDLLGCAQTGTGKTAAFSIPIIQKLYEQNRLGRTRDIKALVLTPTRELAIQIDESFAAYGRTRSCAMPSYSAEWGRSPRRTLCSAVWMCLSRRRADCSTS